MSHLLLHWINDEVKLSREVLSFDKDFCTGYLLGDLLSRFNQQADFEYFIDRDNSDAKINNFTRLHATFTKLNIKFDTRAAYEIMQGNGRYVRNLLYQVFVFNCKIVSVYIL